MDHVWRQYWKMKNIQEEGFNLPRDAQQWVEWQEYAMSRYTEPLEVMAGGWGQE